MARASPLTRALSLTAIKWPEIRQQRRKERLDAIRRVVAAIGAPAWATEDATANQFSLSGATHRGRCTTSMDYPSNASPTSSPTPSRDRRTAPIASRGEATAAAHLVVFAPTRYRGRDGLAHGSVPAGPCRGGVGLSEHADRSRVLPNGEPPTGQVAFVVRDLEVASLIGSDLASGRGTSGTSMPSVCRNARTKGA